MDDDYNKFWERRMRLQNQADARFLDPDSFSELERLKIANGTLLANNITLQKKVEDLEALLDGLEKFHPNCPDQPCPGVFPYCENLGVFNPEDPND